MDTKIPSTFWSDPAHDGCDGDVLLAILWLNTNDRLNVLGFAEISPRVFEFQTRKPFAVLERAYEALGKGLVRDGNSYWLRDHVREQVGTGFSLVRNNMFKPLVRAWGMVASPSIREAILQEYPELSGRENQVEPEGLQEGLKGFEEARSPREEKRREEKRGEEQRDGGVGEGKKPKPKAGSSRPDDHAEPMRSRMKAVGAVMGRRPESVWNESEKKALAAAGLLELSEADFEEQVQAVSRFYRAEIPKAKQVVFWRRTTLPILLNNWPSELDKARKWGREAAGETDSLKMIA